MSKNMISVIMSVYNDELYLSDAIESILNQSYKDFEFIIVDDGSNDKSLDIIMSYAKQDSRIVVISHENKGLTKSLNIAIQKAKGNYIARMDSDDVSHKERFSKQVNFLDLNKDYALVGTNVEKIDEEGKHLEFNITKYSNADIQKTLCTRNCFAHGSVMINKELLKNQLFYDEEFKYSQDFKLWTKIAKKYKVSNIPDSLYQLRIHRNSISKKKVEEQSIYAGIISYEFEESKKIKEFKTELATNEKLRKKIGIILLMQFKPELASKYFTFKSIYFYISLIMKFIDLKKIKRFFK